MSALKKFGKKTFPALVPVYRFVKRELFNRVLSMESVFQQIYETNYWGVDESVSGAGSTLAQTERLRRELPGLLAELKVRTLLDAPCGDFNWMKEVPMELDSYVGLDIVPSIIAENSKRFGSRNRSFRVADVTADPLPRADLILCRDLMIHLSFRHIAAAVKNMKRSGSELLLTTTYPDVSVNQDIVTGSWRPINLEVAPFSFPKPIRIICDGPLGAPAGPNADGAVAPGSRALGLWRLADLG